MASGGHGMRGRGEPLHAPHLSDIYANSAIQQQDYSATIWLRSKEKLEHSQQKCIAIFALLCCFAVLVALTFSAVDVWGEDEDGITEENCNRHCRIVLVENIPEDLPLSVDGTTHVPLSTGLNSLLDQAKHSVEVVSPVWNLNSWDQETWPNSGKQGQLLFQRLLNLKTREVKLKIASSLTDSAELQKLTEHGAEVRFVNMSALTRGGLHSNFWVVDRKHVFIGSASMDWRSLSKRKELGVMVYNCSCLAIDLHRVFSFYWQLQYRDYIPSIWSKRVTALYGKDSPVTLYLNDTEVTAYVSTSPDLFCPKDRAKDIDVIQHVMQDAKLFIYISVTDYLPLLIRRSGGSLVSRYWSPIDEMIREAVVLRGVKVRMLISFWKQTHPLTFNFIMSLKSLCMELANCSLEVKFFSRREQMANSQPGINHNKYMVTDSAVYIGNHDWVGSEFAYNAGTGLVIKPTQTLKERGATILEQVKAVFERDWHSRYAKTLQASNRTPEGSKYRNLHNNQRSRV
ncbi:inactive phospholipase D5-like isoform X1 [Salvelinus fontinalis]|uniref:inactive phospholipase D5-like isoform X1 n=1 Tax=Salvelinus fontinalis TaxID=8038 RepID=UPI0024851009|nr:inactive phospholipase D5-like isoform X1 [Salvelinus fontinalis]